MRRITAEESEPGQGLHAYRRKVFNSRNHLEDTVSDYRDGIDRIGKSPTHRQAKRPTGVGLSTGFGLKESFTTDVVYLEEGMP